ATGARRRTRRTNAPVGGGPARVGKWGDPSVARISTRRSGYDASDGPSRRREAAESAGEAPSVVCSAVGARQLSEGESGEEQPEVAKRYVPVAPGQGQGNDGSEDPRTEPHPDSGDDLDHADDAHHDGPVDPLGDEAREILGPIHHQVGELVETEEDRGDREPEMEDPVGGRGVGLDWSGG